MRELKNPQKLIKSQFFDKLEVQNLSKISLKYKGAYRQIGNADFRRFLPDSIKRDNPQI